MAAIYELIRQLPEGMEQATVGQLYSNYGCDYGDRTYYPLFYQGTDIEEYAKWGKTGIHTTFIENNPKYFKKIKEHIPEIEPPKVEEKGIFASLKKLLHL